MRKLLRYAAPPVVLAAAAGAVFVLASAKEAPEKNIEEERLVSLYVDAVRSERVTVSVRTQGEVRAKTNIGLVPQVTGRVVAVADAFNEGGYFEPGETLLQIDDSDYRLAVTSSEAQVAQAAVRVEQELADASIKRKQWEEWVVDGEPTPLALNQPQVAEAQAQLRAAEANLETAKLNLARTRIQVPFKGRVSERTVGLGEFVAAGTSLGRVFATDTVEVRLPLTDAQLAELALPIGFIPNEMDAPDVTLSTIVGGKRHTWKGKITRVNAAVDNLTRLVYAVAEVQDPYGAAADQGMPLAVGLFVSAEIEGVVPHNGLVMPRTALRQEDQVYVITDDNKLEVRTVDVLSTSQDRLVVLSGVSDGEMVVTAPVRGVYDGMPAQPITRSARQPAATSSR